MGYLYNLFEKAQLGNDEALTEIICFFKGKINKSLFQTVANEREDLRQEIILKIAEEVKKYDLNSIPGYRELQDMTHTGRIERR